MFEVREGASCVYQVNGRGRGSPDRISGKANPVMWETLAEHNIHVTHSGACDVGKWGHINGEASLWWETSARAR